MAARPVVRSFSVVLAAILLIPQSSPAAVAAGTEATQTTCADTVLASLTEAQRIGQLFEVGLPYGYVTTMSAQRSRRTTLGAFTTGAGATTA